MADVVPFQLQAAAGDPFQAGQAIHKLGLAVALNAGNAHDLARPHFQRNALYGIVFMHFAGHHHVLHLQHGLAGL